MQQLSGTFHNVFSKTVSTRLCSSIFGSRWLLVESPLLEPRHRLGISRSARFQVRRLEFRQLEPAQHSLDANSSGFGRLLDVALAEQDGDRLFLFVPEH
jgi:hypothetical protein